MDTSKIKIKIGENEFEAEGPHEVVAGQFQSFKELIELVHSAPKPLNTSVETGARSQNHPQNNTELGKQVASIDPADLHIIFTHDSKKNVISIRTLPPQGERRAKDSMLMIAYGYKKIADQDEVLVTKFKDSLAVSGIAVDRMDRAIAEDILDGLYLKSGKGKGGRYRLTNTGVTKAEALIKGILKQVV